MKYFFNLLILFSVISVNVAGQVGINADNTEPVTSAMLDVKSTSKGFLPPRMTTEQMNAILLPVDGLLVYNTTAKSLYCYNGTAWKQFNETSVHTIGESYGGGIVFYVYDGGKHGLIASTSDQSVGVQWYNGTYRYTGTAGDGLAAGAMNTVSIVAAQLADNQTENFAARICADYSITVGGTTYGDWYLPSKYELNLLFLQRAAVGGFAFTDYWCSTENNANSAWSQYFFDGFQSEYVKNGTCNVRAIRGF